MSWGCTPSDGEFHLDVQAPSAQVVAWLRAVRYRGFRYPGAAPTIGRASVGTMSSTVTVIEVSETDWQTNVASQAADLRRPART